MSKNWNKGEEITAEGLNNQGLKVVAQDTPGMTLKVNPGVAITDGVTVKFAGGNTGTFVAPVTDDRIDVVSIDADGDINITQGVEDPSPSAPSYPAGEIALCEVYLRAGCTEILNEDDTAEAYISLDSRPLGAGIVLIDESTADPTPANNAGKGVKLEANGKFSNDFIDFVDKYIHRAGVGESIDGTTTPQAVGLTSDGKILLSEADVSGRQKFTGFFKQNKSPASATILNTTSGALGGFSGFVANAGVNRVVIVIALLTNSSGSPTRPTSATYNGNAMTEIHTGAVQGGSAVRAWWYPLGTNVSNDAAVSIASSGGATNFSASLTAIVVDNAHQTTPFPVANTGAGSSTGPNASITLGGGTRRVINAVTWNAGTFNSWNQSQTNLHSINSGWARIGHVLTSVLAGGSTNYSTTNSSSGNWVFMAMEVAPPANGGGDDEVHIFGEVDGFTGLTPGAKYYVSNTAGGIATTPGTATIPVGKALSATTLFVTD